MCIRDRMEILFINDEENIQINADANNYQSYTIKGSKTSQALINFLIEYRKKDSSLFSTIYNLDALQKQNAKDSTIFWLQKQRATKITDINKFVENTITSSTSPAFVNDSLNAHTVFSSGILSPVSNPRKFLKLILSII